MVYNVLDLKPLFRLSVAHSLPVTCVRWLNRDLVTCSADRCAALWDTSNGERSTLFSGMSTVFCSRCIFYPEINLVKFLWFND